MAFAFTNRTRTDWAYKNSGQGDVEGNGMLFALAIATLGYLC